MDAGPRQAPPPQGCPLFFSWPVGLVLAIIFLLVALGNAIRMKNNEDQPAALSKIRPGQQKGRLKPVFFVSNTATTSTTCHLTAAAITNHEQRSTYLAPGNRHCVRRLIAKARGGRHELRVVQGFCHTVESQSKQHMRGQCARCQRCRVD